MYTQQQLTQVKQIFIKSQKRFPTQAELEAIYAYDYAGFEAYADTESFNEYFGDIFNDAMGEEVFACLIEDALEEAA